MADPKLTNISGIGPATARVLTENGFASVEGVAQATDKHLAKVPGFGVVRAAEVIKAARSLLAAGKTPGSDAAPEKVKKSKNKKKKRGKKGKKGKNKSKKKDKKKDSKKKRKKKRKQ